MYTSLAIPFIFYNLIRRRFDFPDLLLNDLVDSIHLPQDCTTYLSLLVPAVVQPPALAESETRQHLMSSCRDPGNLENHSSTPVVKRAQSLQNLKAPVTKNNKLVSVTSTIQATGDSPLRD